MKSFALAVVSIALGATLAAADPAFRVSYPGGVPRVEIAGDYSLSSYSVWRAGRSDGEFTPVTSGDVLCTGECSSDDYAAEPGRVYWYRFDVILPDGSFQSFGPYRAEISATLARPINASLAPNPGRGPAVVTLTLAGPRSAAPVDGEVAIFDLQGRRVSLLFKGSISTGTTTVRWSGCADDGSQPRAGIYFLRFGTTDARRVVTRIVRIQ